MSRLRKATALRSAPSKDRQIAGVYIAISGEGKAGSCVRLNFCYGRETSRRYVTNGRKRERPMDEGYLLLGEER
ncbi:hypothetical protein MPL3356_390015 [Mesorhizobium plurifarium]|uniref:Uncharacterized protein n=1 Tax=Mesorhizobium plurifarium TaxID=69974 RepID=A0A090E4S6_MESPL|nr:hypothetical protein MPL3356_390015 [Mesorhizobium plurifarium]